LSFTRADDAYALAPMQAGMLFSHLLAPSGGYDLEQIEVGLAQEPAAVAPDALARAWTLVARRHPALTCRIVWDEAGMPYQQPQPNVIVPFAVQDLPAGGGAEPSSVLAGFLRDDRRRGFDLRAAPLMRVTLFRAPGGGARMVWTFHHILMDGDSLVTVLAEVFAAYEHLRAGAPAPSPASPGPGVAHRDYVAWLETLDLAASREVFRALLAGKTAPNELPAPAPLGPVPPDGDHGAYGERTERASVELTRAVHALARRTETSVSTVVQAAWALVVARYSNDDDVVFGSIRSGRRSALAGAARATVGLMINALPMRARCGDELPASALLRQLHEQKRTLRAHEHTPLFEIEAQSQIPRGRRLFETAVMFQEAALGALLAQRGGPAWDRRPCALHEQPMTPLVVKVSDGPAIELQLLHDRRRFGGALAARLLSSLLFVMSELARDEARPLGAISVHGEAELATIRQAWNDTARPFSTHLLIHELFEGQARLRPEAVAVDAGPEGALTYAALERRANRLAHALRARGAGAGVHVGVCLPRGPSLIVAALAVAKAGAAYVPLDPRLPAARLDLMTTGARAALVVTTRAHAARFSAAPAFCLAGDAGRLDDLTDARPAPPAAASAVACVFFTSGTTGTPNAAMLSHRAMVNTLEWVNRELGVRPGDRLVPVVSISFDLSVYDIFGTLGAGATLVLVGEEILASPARLARALTERDVTVWNSAPAALSRVLPFLGQDAAPPPLRLVLLSGDWMPLTLPAALRALCGAVTIVNLGGATEAAIWSNWFRVEAVDPRWKSVPYGAPIQNCRYHILDRALRPVPVGVTGDLYIGGVCLAEGYLDAPALTAERFIVDPAAPTARLYRTGDVARYWDDGTIELLGRLDQQVKIRGFRIELSEVEAALGNLPAVKQAVCVAHQDRYGERFLVAYVVPARAAEGDALGLAQALKGALGASLPGHMIPSQIVFLKELPLSANGKVDRGALRRDARGDGERFVAPRTERERRMVRIWERLLDFHPIGVTDDFFERGGHSLLAVMLLTELKAELDIELTLERLLECRTIEALSRHLDEAGGARGAGRFLRFNTDGRRPPLVLFPEVRGTLYVYRDLPRSFGLDQPLLLAQPAGGPEDGALEPTIERMAAVYAEELARLVPSGPIVVGGFSFGAIVAFELMHQLRQAGRDVPLFVSLDGMAPGYPVMLPLPARLRAHLGYVARAPGPTRGLYLLDRLSAARKALYRLAGREHALFSENHDASPEVLERNRRVYDFNTEALRRYDPGYQEDGPLLLLRAARPERWVGIVAERPDHGWARYIRGTISTLTVPGEHLTMLRPGNHGLIARAISNGIEALVARA
jgi:amino acid adenylation domain-containing protein